MDPRILALVGGDLFYANQLVATLAHMWETAWAQGRLLPGGDAAPAPGPLTPTAPEPAAAVEEPTATVQTLEPAPQGQPRDRGNPKAPSWRVAPVCPPARPGWWRSAAPRGIGGHPRRDMGPAGPPPTGGRHLMEPVPPSKVQARHCQRLAIVYVRQSTMAQVRGNPESTERQYALQDWARTLGWPPEAIQVIDTDLGLSGSQAATRHGFQTLVSQVSLGQVGAIFGLEVSRLARSSADFQRLLQLCALFDTLVVDADGIYDLRQVNDRLILGFKGTMSEAELSVLRGRLLEAKRHKAAKGTLRVPVPVGYIWSPGEGIQFDPDEAVQAAVRRVFTVFAETGTAYGVVEHFHHHQLRFPLRAYGGTWAGQLRWGTLTHNRVLGLLKNPSYTGTYVFGRFRTEKRLDATGIIVNHTVVQPVDQWLVRIPDHHPAYISWAQYEQHQHQLRQNQTNAVVSGAAREGAALLQGLVICGHCGRRMSVRYTAKGKVARRYECKGRWERSETPRATCLTLRGEAIDAAVGQAVVAATTADQIALTLAAWDRLADQHAADDQQWRLTLERAHYEADRAQHQYDATDPANRLVARTLEARWNAKLEALQRVQDDYAAAQATRRPVPTPAEREFLQQLPETLPALWAGASPTDRKRILRCLLEDVTLTAPAGEGRIHIGIRWRSQRVEEVIVPRPLPSAARRRHLPETVARVRELAQTQSDAAIAQAFNATGQRTPEGREFTPAGIQWIRWRHHIPAPPPPADTVTVQACARQFGVSMGVVYTWIAQGVVPATKPSPGHPWALTLNSTTVQHCEAWIRQSAHLRRPQ